ncbi:MAG: hypothetical protein PGN26_05940 [Xylophilus ampelinus]
MTHTRDSGPQFSRANWCLRCSSEGQGGEEEKPHLALVERYELGQVTTRSLGCQPSGPGRLRRSAGHHAFHPRIKRSAIGQYPRDIFQLVLALRLWRQDQGQHERGQLRQNQTGEQQGGDLERQRQSVPAARGRIGWFHAGQIKIYGLARHPQTRSRQRTGSNAPSKLQWSETCISAGLQRVSGFFAIYHRHI